jgi:hypothetical protein
MKLTTCHSTGSGSTSRRGLQAALKDQQVLKPLPPGATLITNTHLAAKLCSMEPLIMMMMMMMMMMMSTVNGDGFLIKEAAL